MSRYQIEADGYDTRYANNLDDAIAIADRLSKQFSERTDAPRFAVRPSDSRFPVYRTSIAVIVGGGR